LKFPHDSFYRALQHTWALYEKSERAQFQPNEIAGNHAGLIKGGEAAPREISFVATTAYKMLLESLGLDGSVSEFLF
jgi:hypothetical protein